MTEIFGYTLLVAQREMDLANPAAFAKKYPIYARAFFLVAADGDVVETPVIVELNERQNPDYINQLEKHYQAAGVSYILRTNDFEAKPFSLEYVENALRIVDQY